jgi:hypothetical protein
MRLRLPGLAALALLSLATQACGGSSGSGAAGAGSSGGGNGGAGGAGASTTTASTGTGSTSCPATSTSMLDGVTIEIDANECTFSLADPSLVTIPYRVVVSHDVAGVTPRPQDAGMCDAPGASGLITFEKVDGGGQQYCLCDVGLCAPTNAAPVTLKAGSYPATFTWDKRNWFGPSDTGNPKGPAFPAGDYTVTVSAIGMHDVGGFEEGFVVTATLPIQLVP